MKSRFVVKIHPAGLALFAAAFLLMDSHLALSSAAALLLHEGSHLLAMQLCGMTCTVELTPFGGMADARHFNSYSPWKRMVSAASGVAASWTAAVICLHYAPHTAFWRGFFQANFSLALLNSLPAWPLDGARVITALASRIGIEQRVKRILSWLTTLLGALFVFAGLYGTCIGIINPTLLVIGPYLCYAARAEIVSDRVRRLEGIDRKLHTHPVIPVALWAGRADAAPDQFGTLLGRADTGRYHVLLGADPVTGKIVRCWTEKEMLNRLLSDGNN